MPPRVMVCCVCVIEGGIETLVLGGQIYKGTAVFQTCYLLSCGVMMIALLSHPVCPFLFLQI